MNNDYNSINPEALRDSLGYIFNHFEENLNRFKDAEGEVVENNFRKHCKATFSGLLEVLECYDRNNEEAKKDKLQNLFKKIEAFDKFKENNSYSHIVNNFNIINRLYNFIKSVQDGKDKRKDIKEIFRELDKSQYEISIFKPFRLHTVKQGDKTEIRFIKDSNNSDIINSGRGNLNLEQVWKSFIEIALQEAEKIKPEIEKVKVKEESLWEATKRGSLKKIQSFADLLSAAGNAQKTLNEEKGFSKSQGGFFEI